MRVAVPRHMASCSSSLKSVASFLNAFHSVRHESERHHHTLFEYLGEHDTTPYEHMFDSRETT